jgi:hypothetical protein
MPSNSTTCVGGVRFVFQPLALAATRDIHADHATFTLKRPRQPVEIARVPRQAMHAYHHARARRVPPIGIRDAVKPVPAEARKASLRPFMGLPPDYP